MAKALGKEVRIGDLVCPSCGHQLDTTRGISGPDPLPHTGDAFVCLYCADIGIFETPDKGPIILRLPSPKERKVLDENPDIISARAAALFINRRKGGLTK